VSFEEMNKAGDFMYYKLGVNVIPANTREKETFENWSQWQDKSIPQELHEQWKKNNEYNKGIAIIPGKIWRGPFKGNYLVAIDLDNKKSIEEFVDSYIGLKELKKVTLVEQRADPNKMHIYFIVDRPIPDKTSDKTNIELLKKINANEIPALEVKSNGKGIMFCFDSPHRNGSNYRNIGTDTPIAFEASQVEERISQICKKYNISYGSVNGSTNNYQIPIADLWKPETKILEGHNRHLELLRIMESELQINKGRKSLEDIKQIVQFWNQKHCDPPLDDIEFGKQWKQAIKFVSKSISDNNHFNGNGHSNKINSNKSQKIESIIELEGRRRNYFEYVVNSIKKTVKSEDALIRQILYTGFSTYVEDDPLNLGILAPTSEGKTYAITESLQYFPDEDVVYIGQMSPKVLVRQKGILIDKKTGESIENKLKELRIKTKELIKKRNVTKDKIIKNEINDEIESIGEDIRKLFENSKTLIDLRGKILVFLEPPQYELWNLLKPILSHDKKEIEFPFVDKTANSNAESRDVVVRGWPACIFCSAKDESKWEIWDEIKSRILVTSPNMVIKKYQESNKLISQSKGYPNSIQQQIIISDGEVEITKNCVLLIKNKINNLKSQNKNGKISMWIPFADLLQKELPANKGTDVRFVKKIFSLLNIVPIVKNDLRMVLMMEGESSIIANLEDLKEVLSITQNFDGLPKFKAEFFNDIFYPCFTKKTEPDSKTNDKGETIKEEEIRAVTTRDLCNSFKEVKKKPISTDNLKHTYLNPLINEGIIDYTESKINSRQNIYYPLVTELLSIESIMNPIDKNSQYSSTIYEKNYKRY
jgi:Bifunctional DNA primase/polymerase, N-terminal